MRDTIKNEEYFIKCISYEKDRINKFTQALLSIGSENIKGRINALTYLANFNKNIFKQSYSIGISIEEIYHYYEDWLKYYSEICTENYSLYDIIDLFSIAVFYEKRKVEFTKYLIIIMNKLLIDDGMTNLYLVYLGLEPKDNNESKLSYLNNLLEDSENKSEVLKSILKDWYKYHHDAYWYDTHKLKTDTYCGYWSFELGAIAKILNLNDEELKEQQYYPYDLVHFQD